MKTNVDLPDRPLRQLALLSLFLIPAFTSEGNAATYYVDDLDSNCSPATTGAGTLTDPWKNLYYATTHLQCGDTLYLRQGTYRVNSLGYDSTCLTANGQHSVAYFTQQCTASNRITVRVYNNERVILDGTSTEIDTVSPNSNWTQCESATRCGSCTSGFTLSNYQRTFYSKTWNFSGAKTPQMWIDPQCNDADDAGCTDPSNTGTRLRWIYAGDNQGCAHLSLLDGACNNSWSSPACGTLDTYAIPNAIVARLPDTVTNFDPDSHRVKISCQEGTCANHVIKFSNARFVDVIGGGNLYVKYGYYGVNLGDGTSDITIDGVKFFASGGRDYGQCVRTGHANNVIVRNSTCAEVAAEGIGFYGGGHGSCVQISGNVAENNLVYNTGFASATSNAGQALDDGIIIKSCNNCVARGNTLQDNGRNGVEVTSNWNGTSLCNSDNVIIENNYISRSCNSSSPRASDDCGGVHLVRPSDAISGSIKNTIIRNNFIFDIVGLRADFSPHGIKIDSGVSGAIIVNNSLRNIAQECIDTNEDSVPSGSLIVKNNAMYQCNVENVGGAGYVRMNTISDWSHSNNTYWGDSNVKAVRINNPSTDIMRDSVASSFESSAIQQNPLFTSSSDLRLATGSPMVNRATDLSSLGAGFNLDIDGQIRPAGAWDIGADEAGSGGSSIPAPPNNLRINP